MGPTKIFASTGKPIMQSASPQMHNAGFAACRINAVYTRLAAGSMEEALKTARQLGISGLNVTAPFKESACKLADSLDGAAQATGAVNTLLIARSGKTRGFNTDVEGVHKALEAAGVRLFGANAVVLGAGGAARAAAYALCKAGANVTVANRTIGKAKKIASRFGCSHCSLDEKSLGKILPRAKVIVSTLSTKERVVGRNLLKKGTVLLDAFYSSETLLAQDAAQAGCKVIRGQAWLLHQGAAAFSLFTGKAAPQAAMGKALQNTDGKIRRKNIALIGFMGSGKSTVARLLGRESGMRVLDTDDMVEHRAGMKIPGIFESRGEARFRALEASAVKDACMKKGIVVSLGGGAVLDAACARAVRKSCVAVWLWASADEALLRLKGDASRPLFNRKDRVQVARRLLRARLPAYAACSDIVVGTEGKTAKKVAELIMDETGIALR
jgi:shikimate dehydrogenase